jgi:biopolymer transport protein ExbD
VLMSLRLCSLTSSAELQKEQPQLYQNLTKILNPDEQQIVQAVVVQADANAVAAQALTAASAAQTNGGAH